MNITAIVALVIAWLVIVALRKIVRAYILRGTRTVMSDVGKRVLETK